MLHIAAGRLAPQQVIASGRAAERITGRGLPVLTGALSYRVDGGASLALPARFAVRAEGFFAFSLQPERDMPKLASAASVVIRASLRGRGSLEVVSERTVLGSAMALVEQSRTLAGQTLKQLMIVGAPFDVSMEVDPAPVALAGVVLRDHDPSEPVGGVSVSAGATTVVTDDSGRFFIASLPLHAVASLTLTEGGTPTVVSLPIDYERPVNRATFSL